MWTGRETLRSLEEAIGRLHGQEKGLDATLTQLAADAERLRAARAEALRQLARVKLDEIAAGRLTEELDNAERRASALIAARGDRIGRLAKARDTALEHLSGAEDARDSAAREVEAALSKLETMQAAAEAAVRTRSDWLAAQTEIEQARAVADEAARKAEQNAAELAEKKQPYDADPLFRYLWERGFGTASYRAGNVTRMADRWLARFVNYADQRANYHMLNEIPLRLAEHARARRAAVAEKEAVRASIERAALRAIGPDALEKALIHAREELARQEDALEAARTELDQADAARDALLAGAGDPEFLATVASLATADAQDDLATLWREARRTATGEDDALVRRIEEVDAKLAATGRELEKTREAAREMATRRTEVEQAREKFRRAGYDHPHAGFGNEGRIAEVLGGILSGMMKGGSLWDILREGYAQRPSRGRPDFGGGFPFPLPRRNRDDDDDDDDQPRRRKRGRVAGGDWRIPGSSGGWAPDWSGGASGGRSGPWGGGSGNDAGPRNDSDDFITGGRF